MHRSKFSSPNGSISFSELSCSANRRSTDSAAWARTTGWRGAAIEASNGSSEPTNSPDPSGFGLNAPRVKLLSVNFSYCNKNRKVSPQKFIARILSQLRIQKQDTKFEPFQKDTNARTCAQPNNSKKKKLVTETSTQTKDAIPRRRPGRKIADNLKKFQVGDGRKGGQGSIIINPLQSTIIYRRKQKTWEENLPPRNRPSRIERNPRLCPTTKNPSYRPTSRSRRKPPRRLRNRNPLRMANRRRKWIHLQHRKREHNCNNHTSCVSVTNTSPVETPSHSHPTKKIHWISTRRPTSQRRRYHPLTPAADDISTEYSASLAHSTAQRKDYFQNPINICLIDQTLTTGPRWWLC